MGFYNIRKMIWEIKEKYDKIRIEIEENRVYMMFRSYNSKIERSKIFKNEKYKSPSLKTASVLYEYMDPRVSKTYVLQQVLDFHNLSMESVYLEMRITTTIW